MPLSRGAGRLTPTLQSNIPIEALPSDQGLGGVDEHYRVGSELGGPWGRSGAATDSHTTYSPSFGGMVEET